MLGAVPVQLAGKGFYRLDRPARGGCDLSRVDPDVGGAVESLSLFGRRLRRGRHLAAAAGLDAGAGGAVAARGTAARRPRPAARRARSAGPARTATRRLSGTAEEPLLPPW